MTARPTLTVLGAGSILPRVPGADGRAYGPAGYAVRFAAGGAVTLLDCGPGSVRALGAAGIALTDVSRVVLSHFHPDHCLDLFALLFARRNPGLVGARPLELVGPTGLRALLAGGDAAFGRWVERRDSDRVVEVEPCAAPEPVKDVGEGEGLRLTRVATGHTPHALAWRVERADGSAALVYSGDSGEVAALADLARAADLFCCECSFADEHAVPHHLTPTAAGRLAQRAGARWLLLTHFYPGLDPDDAVRSASAEFHGPIVAAHDGAQFSFGPEIGDPGA